MTNTDRPFSKKEVARYLGVTERTVDRYRALGLLRSVKVRRTGKVLFRPADVEAALRRAP